LTRTAVAVMALLVVLGVALLAACSSDSADRQLTYSVTADGGQLSASVEDNRLGVHTTWVVLENPPKPSLRELIAIRHVDDEQANGGNATVDVPAGDYSYSVYSIADQIEGAGTPYWLPENRVGGGEVTVP
jgi:hypothetical protein